jgi:hypothetical protein
LRQTVTGEHSVDVLYYWEDRLMMRRTDWATIVVVAALLMLVSPAAKATLITGPWMNATPNQGDGPIHNAATDDPIVGDLVDDPGASSNAADGEMFDSPFPAITLANDGDKIILKGEFTMQGSVNSPATSGTPRTQMRFGLFSGDDVGDDTGWVGYYMSNKHGNAGTPSGVLTRKPVGNTSTYLSVTGQSTAMASVQGDGTAASLFHDGTYSFLMTIERNAIGELNLSATLTGSNGFSQTLSGTDTTAGTLGTYTFDHVGFLFGGNLDADRVVFSNVRVSIPEPGTMLVALCWLAMAAFTGRRARG